MKNNIVAAPSEKAVLETIRKAERFSHTRQYEREELFGNGSWLQKPVKTITDLYPSLNSIPGLTFWIWDAGSEEAASLLYVISGISVRLRPWISWISQ